MIGCRHSQLFLVGRSRMRGQRFGDRPESPDCCGLIAVEFVIFSPQVGWSLRGRSLLSVSIVRLLVGSIVKVRLNLFRKKTDICVHNEAY